MPSKGIYVGDKKNKMQIYLYLSMGRQDLNDSRVNPSYIVLITLYHRDWPIMTCGPNPVHCLFCKPSFVKCKVMPTHLYIFNGSLHTTAAELRRCDRLYGLTSLKYLLSVPLHKKFAGPYYIYNNLFLVCLSPRLGAPWGQYYILLLHPNV